MITILCDIFTDVGDLHARNLTLFYTIVIALVLFAAIVSSALVVKQNKMNRREELMRAVADMQEVQRLEDEREAEKRHRLEVEEAERAERENKGKKVKKSAEPKNGENSGDNGESGEITAPKKKGGNSRKKAVKKAEENE